MRIVNSTDDEIIVFTYNVGDFAYYNVMSNPSLHLTVWASTETTIPPRQVGRLTHRTDRRWLVGVKRGRFDRFFCPLSTQVHTAASDLEVLPGGVLLWRNGPAPQTPPTPPIDDAIRKDPLPSAPPNRHVVGVGKANITDMSVLDKKSALPLQGWAQSEQMSSGLEKGADGEFLPLQARAFLVGDPASQTRVVFVVADIWSCSIAIKQEVVKRLSAGPESRYTADNIWISGTHTHSAMGGYLHHFLYNATGFGFDAHVFESIVVGILRAIHLAHLNLAPGRVRMAHGNMEARITANRSLDAFLRNPLSDIQEFPKGVDESMTVLVFEREGSPGSFETVGALSWFPIHPTSMGEKSTIVSGDNKGHAADKLEHEQRQAGNSQFVAGFANSCAGDVSGNVDHPGSINTANISDQRDPPTFKSVEKGEQADLDDQTERMRLVAEAQKMLAADLIKAAGVELSGPIRAREHRLDMPRRSGTTGTLGLSMSAGSTEDGGSLGKLPEGIVLLDERDPDMTSAGKIGASLAAGVLLALNRLVASLTTLVAGQPLAAAQGVLSSLPFTDPALVSQHSPKPILLAPGMMQPDPWTPDVLPLQLVQIGDFAALGVAAEVTTVAGFRVQQAMKPALEQLGVSRTVVGTYTNGYGQYVTTPQEYESQQYEGASTLWGPTTCDVLAAGAAELAAALSGQATLNPDAPLPDRSGRVLAKRRMTFRNLSGADVTFSIHLPGSTRRLLWPAAEFALKHEGERAAILPPPWSLFLEQVEVVCRSADPMHPRRQSILPATTDLVLVGSDGVAVSTPYFPTDRSMK